MSVIPPGSKHDDFDVALFWKIIKIRNCAECPYTKVVHNGKQRLCHHIKTQVKHPYSDDRVVADNTIADFCPLG